MRIDLPILLLGLAGSAVIGAARPGAGSAQAPTRTTWDGVFTAEQADRGAQIYQGMCASCHGPQLGGIDAAPALNGGAFYANWNGVSLGDMADRVKVSMPANMPGVMSRQMVADVLAYIFSRNGMPAGEQELPRQIPYLRAIAFKAQRGAPSAPVSTGLPPPPGLPPAAPGPGPEAYATPH